MPSKLLKDEKIIFLDIDGVLNCETDFLPAAVKFDPVHSRLQKGERWKIISAGKLFLLNQIIQETGAKIILSSTWRHHVDPAKLTRIFQRYGKIWTHEPSIFVGKTRDWRRPYGSCQEFRQREIEEVVEAHDLENYIILDDCLYIHLPEDERFVHTTEHCGLTILHAYRAMNLLGRKPKYQRKFDKSMDVLHSFL